MSTSQPTLQSILATLRQEAESYSHPPLPSLARHSQIQRSSHPQLNSPSPSRTHHLHDTLSYPSLSEADHVHPTLDAQLQSCSYSPTNSLSNSHSQPSYSPPYDPRARTLPHSLASSSPLQLTPIYREDSTATSTGGEKKRKIEIDPDSLSDDEDADEEDEEYASTRYTSTNTSQESQSQGSLNANTGSNLRSRLTKTHTQLQGDDEPQDQAQPQASTAPLTHAPTLSSFPIAGSEMADAIPAGDNQGMAVVTGRRTIELYSDAESDWEEDPPHSPYSPCSTDPSYSLSHPLRNHSSTARCLQQNELEEDIIELQYQNPEVQDADKNPFEEDEESDDDFLILDDDEPHALDEHEEGDEELAHDSHQLFENITTDIASSGQVISYIPSTRSHAPFAIPRFSVFGNRRDCTPDNDADDFADLVRRTEMKRYYEANPHLNTAPMSTAENIALGSARSFSNVNSDLSIREKPTIAHNEVEGRNMAQSFLESLMLDICTDIRNSTLYINDPSRIGRNSPSKKMRRKMLTSTSTLTEMPSGEAEEVTQTCWETRPEKVRLPQKLEKIGVSIFLKNRKTGNDQITSFPDDPLSSGGREPSMIRMTCIAVVATVLYEAILTRTVITLRDIFYRDKALFKRQDVVDKLVDDLVATAGLKRRDFHVCASAKGLIASSELSLIRRTGEEAILSATTASLIDPVERIERLDSPKGIDWVLVVEKDAVFQTLCSAKLLEDERVGRGVMLTGKGFPDLATRQMLRLIADTFPNARIHALVDADPHGLSILSTYAYGSRSTAHSHDHADLALRERIAWMGVKTSDFAKMGVCLDELLPLEKADLQMASSMLRNHQDLPLEWKRELCHMLHLNRKAEIEIILRADLNANSSEGVHDTFAGLFEDEDKMGGEEDHGVHRGSQEVRKQSKLVEYIVERLLS